MAKFTSRRRFLGTTGSIITGVALAGCIGGDGPDTSNSTEDDSNTDTADNNTQAEDPRLTDIDTPGGDYEVDENVEIDFYYAIGGRKGRVTENLAKEFSELSDTITVNPSHEGDYEDTWNSTLQGIRGDDPPAVAHINAGDTLEAIANNVHIPVEDVMGDRRNEEDFLDAAGSYYVWNDKLQGLPFAMSTVVAHYNADLFEEAGLPTDPEEVSMSTFEDYRRISQQIMEETDAPSGATWPNHGWFYESFIANQYANYINNDNGRSAPATESLIAEDAGQRMYEWIKNMYDNDEYLLSGGWGDARQGYVNEQAAILLDSSSNIVEMKEGADNAGFDSRIGRVPGYEEWNGLVIGGGALFVINGIPDREIEAAAEFLLWMAEPAQQARFHQETGYYPVSKEAEQMLIDDGTYDDQPGLQRAFNSLQETREGPQTAGAFMLNHGQVRDASVNCADRVFQGVAVSDALDQTKVAQDELLQDALERDPRN
jgi:sn-glycerol 3-phosphate transport system substrate-binding protein